MEPYYDGNPCSGLWDDLEIANKKPVAPVAAAKPGPTLAKLQDVLLNKAEPESIRPDIGDTKDTDGNSGCDQGSNPGDQRSTGAADEGSSRNKLRRERGQAKKGKKRKPSSKR